MQCSTQSLGAVMKHHFPSLHVAEIEMFCARVVQDKKIRVSEKKHHLLAGSFTLAIVALIVIIPPACRKTGILIAADDYFFNHPAMKELAAAYRNADWTLF